MHECAAFHASGNDRVEHGIYVERGIFEMIAFFKVTRDDVSMDVYVTFCPWCGEQLL